MAEPRETDHRVSVDEYFALVEKGIISVDDRVELLEGIIVSMPPQTPQHAAGVMCVDRVLRESLPEGNSIRVQMPFMAGATSVPEPDIAVVKGSASDYIDRHPSSALLLVEVAVTSAPQDRLTKAPIYAAAGIRNYWVVNLPGECVEVFSGAVPEKRRYWRSEVLRGGDLLTLEAFPDLAIAAGDLFPKRPG